MNGADIGSSCAATRLTEVLPRPADGARVERLDARRGGRQAGGLHPRGPMAADAFNGARFPTTRMSVVVGLRDPDPGRAHRCFSRIAEAYGNALYKHVRLKWRKSPEDTRDLVQAFLALAFEKEYLSAWDPSRAGFRTFLRTCIDRFVSKDMEASRAQKRGGGARPLSLDFDVAEQELSRAAVPDVESVFEQEWARSVFDLALASLRAELIGSEREVRLRVFEAYDLADPGARPSYQEIAERLSIPATTVTNHLHFVRRELRRHVLLVLRELTSDEAEFRAEARALLGESV